MLDKDQIAAASHSRCTTIGAPAPSSTASTQRCGRATASRAMPSRPRSSAYSSAKPVRLEDRRHQRGRAEAHQCRRARWPDASWRDRHRRWRHGVDGGQRDARRRARIRFPHARRSAAARRALHRPARCSTRSTRCIRRSRFRIRALPISSAPARRRSSPTMPARICSCWALPTTANWRAMDLVEERPVITLRGQHFVGHGKNVLGDPRVALTWLANELRQLGVTLQGRGVVTTGTCHPPLPIQSGDLCRRGLRRAGKGVGGVR